MRWIWVIIAVAIILGITFGCSRNDQYWKQVSKETGRIVNQ